MMKLAHLTLTLLLVGSVLTITQLKAEPETQQTKTTKLHVEGAWAKPNYGPNGAAYFTLINKNTRARHLIGAASKLSKRVELHTHTHEEGVMKMRKLKAPVTIEPGTKITFAPAGHHVMLFALEKKLKEGDELPLTLIFQDGSKQDITAKVRKGAANNEKHRGSHH